MDEPSRTQFLRMIRQLRNKLDRFAANAAVRKQVADFLLFYLHSSTFRKLATAGPSFTTRSLQQHFQSPERYPSGVASGADAERLRYDFAMFVLGQYAESDSEEYHAPIFDFLESGLYARARVAGNPEREQLARQLGLDPAEPELSLHHVAMQAMRHHNNRLGAPSFLSGGIQVTRFGMPRHPTWSRDRLENLSRAAGEARIPLDAQIEVDGAPDVDALRRSQEEWISVRMGRSRRMAKVRRLWWLDQETPVHQVNTTDGETVSVYFAGYTTDRSTIVWEVRRIKEGEVILTELVTCCLSITATENIIKGEYVGQYEFLVPQSKEIRAELTAVRSILPVSGRDASNLHDTALQLVNNIQKVLDRRPKGSSSGTNGFTALERHHEILTGLLSLAEIYQTDEDQPVTLDMFPESAVEAESWLEAARQVNLEIAEFPLRHTILEALNASRAALEKILRQQEFLATEIGTYNNLVGQDEFRAITQFAVAVPGAFGPSYVTGHLPALTTVASLQKENRSKPEDSYGAWIDSEIYRRYFVGVVELLRNVALIAPILIVYSDWYQALPTGWALALMIPLTLLVMVSIPVIFKYLHVPGRGWDVTNTDPTIRHLTWVFAAATLPLLALPWYPLAAFITYGVVLVPLTVYHYVVDRPGFPKLRSETGMPSGPGSTAQDNVVDEEKVRRLLSENTFEALERQLKFSRGLQQHTLVSDDAPLVAQHPRSEDDMKRIVEVDWGQKPGTWDKWKGDILPGREIAQAVENNELAQSRGLFRTVTLQGVAVPVDEGAGPVVKEFDQLVVKKRARYVLRDYLACLWGNPNITVPDDVKRKAEEDGLTGLTPEQRLERTNQVLLEFFRLFEEELLAHGAFPPNTDFLLNWGIDGFRSDGTPILGLFDLGHFQTDFERVRNAEFFNNPRMWDEHPDIYGNEYDSVMAVTDRNVADWFKDRLVERFTRERLERIWATKRVASVRERLTPLMMEILRWAVKDETADSTPTSEDLMLVFGSESLRVAEGSADAWLAAARTGEKPTMVVSGGVGPGTRSLAFHRESNDLTDSTLINRAIEVVNQELDELAELKARDNDAFWLEVRRRFNIERGKDQQKLDEGLQERAKSWAQFYEGLIDPVEAANRSDLIFIEDWVFDRLLNPATRLDVKIPEAILFRAILIAKKVDPENIVVEAQSTTTHENAQFASDEIMRRKPKTLYGSHKPYLWRRTELTLRSRFMPLADGRGLTDFRVRPLQPYPITEADLGRMSNEKFFSLALFLGIEVDLVPKAPVQPEEKQTVPDEILGTEDEMARVLAGLPHYGGPGSMKAYEKNWRRFSGGYWFDNDVYRQYFAAPTELLRNIALLVFVLYLNSDWPLALSSTAAFIISIVGTIVSMVSIPVIFKYLHVPGRGWDVTKTDPVIRRLTWVFAASTLPLAFLPWYPAAALSVYAVLLIPLTVYHYIEDNRSETNMVEDVPPSAEATSNVAGEFFASLAGPLHGQLLQRGTNYGVLKSQLEEREALQPRHRAPFYDASSAEALDSAQVTGFYANPLLEADLQGTVFREHTVDHVGRRIETFDANLEVNRPGDVYVVSGVMTDNIAELKAVKARVTSAIRALARHRGGRAAVHVERYLQKLQIVIEPEGLIQQDRVLDEVAGALDRDPNDVRFEFYTAMPDRVDTRRGVVGFLIYSLLSGLRILPLDQRYRSARRSAIQA